MLRAPSSAKPVSCARALATQRIASVRTGRAAGTLAVAPSAGSQPFRPAIPHRLFSAVTPPHVEVSGPKSDVATRMCSAAAQGNLDELKRILATGADINARSEYYGRTALHDAAAEGQLLVVTYLVQKGANVNVLDKYGNSPLAEAMRQRNKSKTFRDICKLLESAGATRDQDFGTYRYGPEFTSALQKALPLLCERGGWAFGEALVPAQDGSRLMPSGAVWSQGSEEIRFSKLRKSAEVLPYTIAEADFPARVVTTKNPDLLTDLEAARSADRISPQCFRVCFDQGVRSGMSVPVIHKDQVIAVLVFLGLQSRTDLDQGFIKEFSGACKKLLLTQMKSVLGAVSSEAAAAEQQQQEVQRLIAAEGVFSDALVYQEVDWYYNSLGFRQAYFDHYKPQQIAKHIHALIAAKKVAQITGDVENINFDFETPEGWFYLCPMNRSSIQNVERKIEETVSQMYATPARASPDTPSGPMKKRNLEGPAPVPYALSFFRSTGGLAPSGPQANVHLGLYISERSQFREPNPSATETDVTKLGTEVWLKERGSHAPLRERYQRIVTKSSETFAPVIEVFPTENNVTPVMLAYKTTNLGLAAFSELLENNNIKVERKYIDTFANGTVVHTLYVIDASHTELDHLLEQAGLLLHVNNPSLISLLHSSVELYAYVHCAINFIYYFVNQRSEEFVLLAEALKNDLVNTARLNMLQNNLRRDAVTQSRITECVLAYPMLTQALYEDFKRIQKGPLEPNKALAQHIKKSVQSELDEQILTALLNFNQSIIKTNFWKKDKAAVSFRVKTDFMKGLYPDLPFGLFYVMGSGFRGFHMRFRDIARGGIRIVTSAGRQVYRRNLDRLFDENYSLASTQQRKNKDLPEGGSKGVILLGSETSNPAFSFQQYVDSILDLLLPTPEVVNHYALVKPEAKEDEILFFGPDEGTAALMDWACLHAKHRGYKFWKAFTTGKSPTLGGIPHDEYGMTTRSIHKYVTETLHKLGVREEDCTKTQMGGPDGDLGSNEILISKDKTISVVDKSGVLYDPNGINREELRRLVKQRSPVAGFNSALLSPRGFKVLEKDKDVRLPDGAVIESGLAFRNEFHLTDYATADLFVPCGGRPEAVNIRNVKRMFRADGSPRFKYIMEGANLFLTQDARLVLEKAGVILYKDASANKGGVTSSSLEVLAALALTDEEFAEHMQVHPDGRIPDFYRRYVKEVQERIEYNAYLEWACIWKEHELTGTPRCVLTDQLSLKINTLTDGIKAELWDHSPIKRQILQSSVPPALIELIGIDKVIERVPTTYLQAIFGAYIASHYIYHNGLQASELIFYKWMNN